MPRGKKAQRAGRGTRRPFRATETGPKPSSTNKSGNENTALPEKLPQIPNNLALTLVDAARETGKHDHKAWGALALRTHPVLFVSAGSVEPLKPLEDMLCEATLEESKSPAVPAPGKPSTSPPAEEHGWPLNLGRSSSHEQQPKPHHHSPDASYCHFFYDTGKTHAVNAGVFPRDQNETSELVAEESDSSAEIIIYQGRTKPRDRATGPKLPGKSNNAKLLNDSSLVSNATENKSTKTAKQMPPQDAHMATPELSIVSKRTRRKGKRVANPLRDSEEAKLADYIDNIREHGESYDMLELHHHHQTDLGGEDISLSSDVSDASELSSSSGEDGPVFGHFGNQKLGTKYGDGNDKETMAESPTEVSEGQLDDQTLARLLQDNVLVDGPDSATKNAQYDSDCLRHTTAWCADQPGADFDVMDWERPSIRRRKKGKGAKGRLQLDISDSELEQTLQTAWHNDRFKKAERKRQREEMRALGMLGTKTSPDDMRAKYPNGISVDEIGEELRQFLVNRSALFVPCLNARLTHTNLLTSSPGSLCLLWTSMPAR